MATTINLYVDAGSTYSNTIVARIGESTINLTDHTVKSQIRKSYGSSVAYNFTATISNSAAGQILLQLTSEQSDLIPPGRWLYDVEITSLSGVKTRVAEGIVVVTPQITKI